MIDFEKIIKSTHQYNFHTHTQYCDSRDNIESFVKSAISQDFHWLGFSPHSPVLCESGCNMKKELVAQYTNEVETMKSKYGSQINIFTGMEIDFFDNWGPSNEYFKSLPLDYRIGSIHFIPSFNEDDEYVDVDGCSVDFKKKMSLYFDNDIKKVVTSFYNQTLKMIDAGGFDIIGHFDKISNNANSFMSGIEEESWYKKLVREVFDAIIENKYIIELNTKAYGDLNRFFPNKNYFKWIKDYNAPFVVNSDAHFCDKLNSGRNEAFQLLNEI